MPRPPLLTALLALSLAACSVAVTPAGTPKAKATAKPGAATASPKPTERTLQIEVKAPGVLGSGGLVTGEPLSGVIANAGGALVAAGGGNLVAAGGGNLVAAGGGNLVAAGGGNYQLLASSEGLVDVAQAQIQVQTIAGKLVGTIATSGKAGAVSLPKVPDGELLTVIVLFKLGGKFYRLAAMLPPGKPPGTVTVDPINTMIEARLRDVLGSQTIAAPITHERLIKVHAACDRGDVAVQATSLLAERTLTDVTKDLNDVWTTEIAAKVKDAADLATIRGFVSDVKGAVGAATPGPSAPATAGPAASPTASATGGPAASPTATPTTTPTPAS